MSPVAIHQGGLAGLLASKAAGRASGIVRASRGKLVRLFCLEEGWLVFAASNLIEEQLDAYLVRNGSLSASERSAAAQQATTQKKKVVQILVEQEIVPAQLLRRSLEQLSQTLLSSCLEWPDGEFRFEAGRPKLDGAVQVRLSVTRLILLHARSYPTSLDAVRIRLGPPDVRLQLTPRAEGILQSLDSRGPVLDHLLQRCDDPVPLGELLDSSPGDEEQILRALYGLRLLGVLDEVAHEATRTRAADTPLTTEECEALLRRAENANYYGVLGLARGAASDRVRGAYYALARRYHPDRFRSGTLKPLLNRMERYFTQVTEAYNTLSDPVLRLEYERQLDQTGLAPSAPQPEEVARQNFLRARQLIERRRYTDAVRFLENAIQLDGSLPEYYLTLGELLSGNPRRRVDAEDNLLRAATLDPGSIPAYLALGRLYLKAGRDADAARMFKQALHLEPDHAEASAELARLGAAGVEAREGGLLRNLFRS